MSNVYKVSKMSSNSNETYVYLTFGGKINTEDLKKPVFLRIVNLDTPNPLVQFNDQVFKGKYETCLGTNLFFEQADNPRTKSIYEIQSPIELKFLVSQIKMLSLQQVKVLPKSNVVPQVSESLTLNFKMNYKTVLEKLEKGALNLNDLVEATEECKQSIQDIVDDKKDVASRSDLEEVVEDTDSKTKLDLDYAKLKQLARRPTRRKIEEENVNCDPKYMKSLEFNNLKCQILKPCDAFLGVQTEPINEETLENAVDLDRCKFFGLIADDDTIEVIKEKTFTLDNFDNLSYPAKYCVLAKCAKEMEENIRNMKEDELQKVDKFGRTCLETLEIYKNFLKHFNGYISSIET